MSIKKNTYLSCLIVLIAIISGCENNIQQIKTITNLKEVPVISSDDMEIIYSDSAKVQFKVVTRQLSKYNTPEKQYVEFPKGMTVYKYDRNKNIEAIIKANYAIYYESQKLWEAHDNVEAKNLKKNEQINTEELFWDQTKGRIYSTKFTKIENADGVFTGEGGFESREDLTKWTLKGSKGKVNIKDEINNAQENP